MLHVCRRNGSFTGFPVMGMRWQRMESHALRSAYGMEKQQKGILVRHIQPTYETAKHLRPDDIIMRFDGVQVASDGTVPFRYDVMLTLRLAIVSSQCRSSCQESGPRGGGGGGGGWWWGVLGGRVSIRWALVLPGLATYCSRSCQMVIFCS